MYTWILVFFNVFLKNRNISPKIKRSKVTDYAALKCCLLAILSCDTLASKQKLTLLPRTKLVMSPANIIQYASKWKIGIQW